MTTLSLQDALDNDSAWTVYQLRQEAIKAAEIETAYLQQMQAIVPPLLSCSVSGDGS